MRKSGIQLSWRAFQPRKRLLVRCAGHQSQRSLLWLCFIAYVMSLTPCVIYKALELVLNNCELIYLPKSCEDMLKTAIWGLLCERCAAPSCTFFLYRRSTRICIDQSDGISMPESRTVFVNLIVSMCKMRKEGVPCRRQWPKWLD